jgi:hypothetical protein
LQGFYGPLSSLGWTPSLQQNFTIDPAELPTFRAHLVEVIKEHPEGVEIRLSGTPDANGHYPSAVEPVGK